MFYRLPFHINRITVEFKSDCIYDNQSAISILIESQWNLNSLQSLQWRQWTTYINRITVEFKWFMSSCSGREVYILIESQWNLNTYKTFPACLIRKILIESQWNLNVAGWKQEWLPVQNINRITVEFKYVFQCLCGFFCFILIESQWNLNIFTIRGEYNASAILIESQWNLNYCSWLNCVHVRFILIESQWNLNSPTWRSIPTGSSY